MTMSSRTRLLVLPLCCGVAVGGASAQTTPSTTTGTTSKQTSGSAQGTSPAATPTRTGGASGMGEMAPPAHPLTSDQTAEMLKLMGFQKNMDGMLSQTIANQKQAAPFVPADVWTDFQSTFSKVDYNAVLQPVFAKYLSQEDAAKALEFYRTPAGQHVLEAQPMLMRDIAMTAQQNGQKVSREVIDRHRPEIEAAQKKYQQEQQGPTSGAGAGSGSGAPGSSTPGSTAPGSTAPKPGAPSTTSPNGSSSNTTSKPQ